MTPNEAYKILPEMLFQEWWKNVGSEEFQLPKKNRSELEFLLRPAFLAGFKYAGPAEDEL
jgi:hypothetical protein